MATVTLGDVLQRVAVGLHHELEQSRGALRGMDPELRTKYLRAYLTRTLKKLLQLYAICQWLDKPGVLPLFLDDDKTSRGFDGACKLPSTQPLASFECVA